MRSQVQFIDDGVQEFVPPLPLVEGTVWDHSTEDFSSEIITSLEDLYAIQNDWNVLALPTGNPLLQFTWYASCAEAFSENEQLHIIVLRDSNDVIAIAPLVKRCERGVHRLEMLGSAILCEPVGFLYRDEGALAALVEAIADQQLPFISGKIDVTLPEDEMIRTMCNRHRMLRVSRTTSSPYLPISVSWDEFERTISSSRRSSLRRALRRAQNYGKVSMEILTPDVNETPHVLQEMYDVEHASWKSRTGTSIRSNPLLEKFFTGYARKMAAAGALRLCLMRINGKPIAMQIALDYNNRYWVLKVGYDEHFAQCSPGILLMHHTVQYAFRIGSTSVEFLGRDEPWIHIWTENHRSYRLHRIYPLTAGGVSALANDGMKFVTRAAHQYMNKVNK